MVLIVALSAVVAAGALSVVIAAGTLSIVVAVGALSVVVAVGAISVVVAAAPLVVVFAATEAGTLQNPLGAADELGQSPKKTFDTVSDIVPSICESGGQVRPHLCDLAVYFTWKCFDNRSNGTIFNIIDDTGGFRHCSRGKVDYFCGNQECEVDHISDLGEGFLRQILYDGWHLAALDLFHELLGLGGVSEERLDLLARNAS